MKYRKRPIVIEAVRWMATKQSWDEIKAMGCPTKPGEMGTETFIIPTLEGDMKTNKGDWIIKGVNTEFYPCKPDIFDKTYEPAEESPSGLIEALEKIRARCVGKYVTAKYVKDICIKALSANQK